MGIDQNNLSSKSVDGTTGESGISTIILDIEKELGDDTSARDQEQWSCRPCT